MSYIGKENVIPLTRFPKYTKVQVSQWGPGKIHYLRYDVSTANCYFAFPQRT